MSEDSLRRWIEQRAVTIRNASVYSTLPLRFDNVRFNQPKKAAWAYIYCVDGDAFNVNIGKTRTIRHPGVITIEIRVPKDDGTATCNKIAKIFGDGYRNRNETLGDDTITTRAATSRGTPESEEFYVKSVFIPFWRDETYQM